MMPIALIVPQRVMSILVVPLMVPQRLWYLVGRTHLYFRRANTREDRDSVSVHRP